LSQEYTLTDGWETLDVALLEAGYLYGEVLEEERHEEGEQGTVEFFHKDPIRVVIVDVEGYVLQDNFSKLVRGEAAPDLDGQRVTIFDLHTRQPVGFAYVDVNREFLATESHGFLQGMLFTTTIGGLLTAITALLLAAWLSRRITAPVTALTQATQAIAQHGDTALLPVTSSDELGQMSAAFNQMTTALQTQRDLRQRLINDVSHELNTPLSFIQLEAKGLRDGLQTPTRAADHIIQEVNMLRNLVRNLNWLAETDSSELQLTVEPCSIHQLLTTEVERWQPQAVAHQITLSLKPLPGLPMLNLDRTRMSQALGNVVHNALQHTEVGGRVTVAVTERKTFSSEMGRCVKISVTDDGVGIDAADLPHIFNRLYRTDQSRSRRTGGTGLGLAIARAIVEAHNGTIAVTSDGLGQGTTVQFDLPLH
jgi:signal transduction histidine kinase